MLRQKSFRLAHEFAHSALRSCVTSHNASVTHMIYLANQNHPGESLTDTSNDGIFLLQCLEWPLGEKNQHAAILQGLLSRSYSTSMSGTFNDLAAVPWAGNKWLQCHAANGASQLAISRTSEVLLSSRGSAERHKSTAGAAQDAEFQGENQRNRSIKYKYIWY